MTDKPIIDNEYELQSVSFGTVNEDGSIIPLDIVPKVGVDAIEVITMNSDTPVFHFRPATIQIVLPGFCMFQVGRYVVIILKRKRE